MATALALSVLLTLLLAGPTGRPAEDAPVDGPSGAAREEGAAAPTDTVTVLDGVYTPEQALEGERLFQRRCSSCHAPGFFQAGTFVRAWTGRPVRSLFRRLVQTMPEDDPGGMDPGEYASVIAYILDLNEYPAGDGALPSDEEALRRILMVEKPEGGH